LVGLDVALANVLDDPSYLYTCAAGFSGVIFALKVLTTYELPHETSMVMGILPVPMRYACWAELILIQLLVPNASFTGHLAGIIVGLLYVKGPLKPIMNGIAGIGKGFNPNFKI
jgi:rhomboid domain-containing protein 1